MTLQADPCEAPSSESSRPSSLWLVPGSTQIYFNPSFNASAECELYGCSPKQPLARAGTMQVMADVGKYIDHIEEEERRSHPFGVTNVLLNGLNGRKSKSTLDTGRALTWICFFFLVLGICGTVIYLSARAAVEANTLNCRLYNICSQLYTALPPILAQNTNSTQYT